MNLKHHLGFDSEQAVLRTSIAVTTVVAGFGIAFGILSGSFSIAFDGIYSLADASMSVLALVVSRLIALSADSSQMSGKLRDRFTMGFWHLEPIVLSLNVTLLMGVSIYALVNAIGSLLAGGRVLEFDFAILYAVVTLITCATMAILETRAGKRLRSDFVKLDAKSWVMSGSITAALLIAFCFGYAVEGTRHAWIAPYIDPAVLAIVCVVIIPLPIATLKRSLSDILLVTPQSLKRHVDEVAAATVAKHGFLSYRAYLARVGRFKQIELYFIVAADTPARNIGDWDRIRDEIGEAIGGEGNNRWLTIVFTGDIEWAS